MSLFPLNYTLYLTFRVLATVGDIYRGQHVFHTQHGYQSLTRFILLKIN